MQALAEIQRGLEIDPTSNGLNFYKGIVLRLRADAMRQFSS